MLLSVLLLYPEMETPSPHMGIFSRLYGREIA